MCAKSLCGLSLLFPSSRVRESGHVPLHGHVLGLLEPASVLLLLGADAEARTAIQVLRTTLAHLHPFLNPARNAR